MRSRLTGLTCLPTLIRWIVLQPLIGWIPTFSWNLWVGECHVLENPVNFCVKMSINYAQIKPVNYAGIMRWINKTASLRENNIAGYMNCSMAILDIQMKKSCSSSYLYSWFAIHFLCIQNIYHHLQSFKMYYDMTQLQDMMPWIILFLNFNQTLGLYTYHLSQHWFVKILEFVIHWCTILYYKM